MNALENFELSVDRDLIEAGIAVGFLLLADISNRMRRAGFESMRAAVLRDFLDNSSLDTLTEHPHIRGYRALHRRFGVEGKMAPSPESLYAALFKHGELKPINPLVDIYNYVALKHRLSCGAHDLDEVAGCIDLRRTIGNELFQPLGSSKERYLPAGEYAYVDGTKRVVCRLECKQAAHSAVTERTRNIVVIVQGNDAVSAESIYDALMEITSLVRRCIGEPAAIRRLVIPDYVSELPARAVNGQSA